VKRKGGTEKKEEKVKLKLYSKRSKIKAKEGCEDQKKQYYRKREKTPFPEGKGGGGLWFSDKDTEP
jgi:hypothetical protein